MDKVSTTSSGITKIQNTKKELLNSLLELSKHQSIDEITVSTLCRHANVNRTTFYKYYTIPSDILLEKLKEIVKESSSFATEVNPSIYENMLRLARIFYENRQLMELYFMAPGNYMPIILKGISLAVGQAEYLKKPANNFLAGGVCGLAMYWMQQGFKDTPEVIASMLTEYIIKIME